jgi:hypothetical protein
MKKILFIFFISVFISSCKKEEKKHSVFYRIKVTSGNPVYSVSFSGEDNTTLEKSSISSQNSSSAPISDKKDGSAVFLTLQGGNGGSYLMDIYIDGYLQIEERMDDPYGPKTIEATVRD